jgi:hypothetical protein
MFAVMQAFAAREDSYTTCVDQLKQVEDTRRQLAKHVRKHKRLTCAAEVEGVAMIQQVRARMENAIAAQVEAQTAMHRGCRPFSSKMRLIVLQSPGRRLGLGLWFWQDAWKMASIRERPSISARLHSMKTSLLIFSMKCIIFTTSVTLSFSLEP